MISLRLSTRDELEAFNELDQQLHASNFINSTGLDAHQTYYDDSNITYLSIENKQGELCGYFILMLEPGSECVEFRRILIDKSKRGVGQVAITEMENYCIKSLGAKSIWLDVYEDNVIGRHIYQKQGYRQFKLELVEGRKLLFYSKSL